MPAKLDRCVDDIKSKGGAANPWAVCNASISKGTKESKIQEKINANRQVPVFNPPVTKGKVEPDRKKSKKNIGGARLNQDSVLWKSIFDSQLKQNVKEPKI